MRAWISRHVPRAAVVGCAFFFWISVACTMLAAGSPDRPNIVIILVDDMGFSDIGCYGGEIPTPHLDRLAANGVRFTQFYNTGRCCPTRATVLTGLYAHQAGVGHMTGDYGVPGYRGALNQHCVTLGDVSSSAGYLSIVAGKWHVGHRDRSMWPLGRGFDRFYGVPEGGGFYFQVKPGRSVVRNDSVVADVDHPLPEGWYSTDAWTEAGLAFVDEALAAKKPFLLYLAHNAPHFPLQANAEDIARFRGRYRRGWDELSRERYQRQIQLGLIDPKWQKAPRADNIPAWSDLSAMQQDTMDHIMATYAACIYRMDQAVGQLVEGLRKRNQLDNTLILFMSDNGGNAEGGIYGKSIGDPTTPQSNWFCGKSWAWMQNTPFRRFKHYNHEGGIATPLIVHWPAKINDPGAWRRQPCHMIDVMATVLDVTGARYPSSKHGHAITPAEGTSLLPAIDGKPLPDRPLFWEHEGNAAVRIGNWKLVRLGGRGQWELYDMAADRTEQHDLAAQHPDKAAQLRSAWLAWARRCHVKPDGLPNKQRKRQNKKTRAN